MKVAPILNVDQLSVEFGTRNGIVKALKTVSFDVERGEIVGLVGESGSGKSVTAYTILGLLGGNGKATGGEATYGGVQLTGSSERALQDLRGREISMIFQNPRAALNPIRPVGKQIADVLVRHARATRGTARARAVDMLRTVRIHDPERRYWSYPYELSGGMCQRVMIAMALACDPELLIADEPTTGLDVTTQKAIMDLVMELASERKMSVVLITHDLGLAARYCRRIVVMRHGEVVEAAPVERVFRTPEHDYTKMLIAATPGPETELEDLTLDGSAGVIPKDRRDGADGPRAGDNVATSQARLLEVRDLVKEYPIEEKGLTLRSLFKTREQKAFRAVDGISFSIGYGESLGLVGESGCGKSTTASIVARLSDPTSGDVTFDGDLVSQTPARRFAKSPWRSNIQLVFQDATESLNPRFRVIDAIADPIKQLSSLSKRSEIRARVEELAELVGLPHHLLTRFPHQLSGGQKARVGIARAIALNPKLVILDEPTSALDVSVQAVVLRLLDKLRGELGLSYLFISHDLNVVRLLCDRVIVMNKGRIIESGRADDVLRNPKSEYTRTLIDAVPHFEPDGDGSRKMSLPPAKGQVEESRYPKAPAIVSAVASH